MAPRTVHTTRTTLKDRMRATKKQLVLKRIFNGFPEDSRFMRVRTAGVQGSQASRLKNLRFSGFEILEFRFEPQLWAAAPTAHAFQIIEIFLIPFQITQNPSKTS